MQLGEHEHRKRRTGEHPCPPVREAAHEEHAAREHEPDRHRRQPAQHDLAEVKKLLDGGADVNAADVLGRTPLHTAAFHARQKTSLLLIGRGANLEARDRVGMTPIHAAVLAGSLAETELLITMGADVKAGADGKTTALHLAAATGQPDLAKLLMQHGADPKAKDTAGNPPQFYATRNQHPATASVLQDVPGKK